MRGLGWVGLGLGWVGAGLWVTGGGWVVRGSAGGCGWWAGPWAGGAVVQQEIFVSKDIKINTPKTKKKTTPQATTSYPSFLEGGRRKTRNDSGVLDGLSSSLKKPGICRVCVMVPNVFRPL